MHEIGQRNLHDIIMQRIDFFNHNFLVKIFISLHYNLKLNACDSIFPLKVCAIQFFIYNHLNVLKLIFIFQYYRYIQVIHIAVDRS